MGKTNYMLRFTTSGDASYQNLKFSEKLDYNSRAEAIKVEDGYFLFESKQGYLTRSEANGDQTKYFDSQEKEILYFDKNGVVYKDDYDRRNLNVELLDSIQSKAYSCLYESVLSFDSKFTNECIKNKYSTTELFIKVKPHLELFLLDNNFDLDNTIYFANFHTNTEHLHLHFDFIEIDPSKFNIKQLMCDKKSLGRLRKKITLDLDMELKNELSTSLKQVQVLKDNFLEVLNNFDYKLYEDRLVILADKIHKLEKVNDTKVRGLKNISDPEILKLLDQMTNQIIEDDISLKYNYKKYDNSLVQQNMEFKKLYGDGQRNFYDNKIEELRKQIKNDFIRQAKYYKLRNYDYKKSNGNFKFNNASKIKYDVYKLKGEVSKTQKVIQKQIDEFDKEALK